MELDKTDYNIILMCLQTLMKHKMMEAAKPKLSKIITKLVLKIESE